MSQARWLHPYNNIKTPVVLFQYLIKSLSYSLELQEFGEAIKRG